MLPASYSSTAGPVASGAAASTAVTNLRSTAVLSGSPLGNTCTRARPSAVTHCPLQTGGDRVAGDALRLQRLPQIAKRGAQRLDDRRRGPLRASAGSACASSSSKPRQAPGRPRARPVPVLGGLRERGGGRGQRVDGLPVGRRRLDLLRLQRRPVAIGPSLQPQQVEPPPTDQQTIEALTSTAATLSQVASNHKGPGAEAARRLSGLLVKLAHAAPAARQRAELAIAQPLRVSLDDLRQVLTPERITRDTIPAGLKSQWLTADGRARVQALPKGDPDNTEVLRHFVTAILAVAPSATGPAVLLFEAGKTVVRAFIEAGVFAICAIVLLLTITLRRVRDVLLTLVPLLVAGVVTLELAVAFGIRLNFANIIALPLLLGVGVAFKIYYMLAWRSGRTALVQSTLTRAVIFSAMTTATAFGSLWMSSDPGTSSMGELMALALVCTMAAAVLFQPALMGPPRRQADWFETRLLQRDPAIIVERVTPPIRAPADDAASQPGEQPAEHEFEK